MSTACTRVLVLSGSQLLADATALLLTASGRFSASSQSDDAAAHQGPPDLVVVDAGAHDTAVPALDRIGIDAPRLLLTPAGAPWADDVARDIGAAGRLSNRASAEGLFGALEELHREGAISTAVADGHQPAEARQGEASSSALLAALTGRERQLLQHLREGWTTARIAGELRISPHTVRTHLQNLTAKLGVRSRVEAVAFAERHDPSPRAPSLDLTRAATDAQRVVVAASHPLHGAGLAAALSADGLAATTADPNGVLLAATRHAADVVLLVVDPPEAASPHCASLKEAESAPRVVVVVVSPNAEDTVLREAVQAGADGYLAADASLSELTSAVRQVARGEAYVPARMLGTLLRDLIARRREEDAVVDRFARLSKREREVLSLLADGLDHEQIGTELFVSPHTTRTHIQNVLKKLEVHSRLEAVTLATRHRLLDRFTAPEVD